MNLTEGAGARMNHRGAIILATERALCVLLLSRTGARHRPRRVPVRIIFRESFGRVSCVPPKDIKVNHLSDICSRICEHFLTFENFFDLEQRSIRRRKKETDSALSFYS